MSDYEDRVRDAEKRYRTALGTRDELEYRLRLAQDDVDSAREALKVARQSKPRFPDGFPVGTVLRYHHKQKEHTALKTSGGRWYVFRDNMVGSPFVHDEPSLYHTIGDVVVHDITTGHIYPGRGMET